MSKLKFNCACGQKLAVKEEMAGQSVRCPRCKSVQKAPEPLLPHSEITQIPEDEEKTKPMPHVTE